MSMHARSFRSVSLVVMLASSCGAPVIDPAGGKGTGGAGGAGGRPGAPPSLTPLPPAMTGGSGAPPPSGGGGSDLPTCGAESAKAIPLPVDIFILQDRSGSMLMPAQPTAPTSKWDSMKQALASFLQSPNAAGLGVGLGFFPPLNAQQCNVAAYSTPTVGIAPLPGSAPAITAALGATVPNGGTPTRPALDGAVLYAHAWEMMNNRRVAIALATDGEPNQCNSTLQAVSASAAAAAATGIFTFVIGVGPALQNLNAIAQAGKTNAAYLVETASTDQLIAAFKSIQMQAAKLACSFAIPPSPSGQTLDPTRVNVRFTPTGNPAMAAELGMVPGRAQCGPQGGWFFDNPAAPTSVSLCDASCQTVNTSPDGVISLVFGCKTRVIQ
jgi:hypothetical protein